MEHQNRAKSGTPKSKSTKPDKPPVHLCALQDAVLSAVLVDPEADCDLCAGGLALLLGRQRGGADPTLTHRLSGLTGTPIDKGTANPTYWL